MNRKRERDPARHHKRSGHRVYAGRAGVGDRGRDCNLAVVARIELGVAPKGRAFTVVRGNVGIIDDVGPVAI